MATAVNKTATSQPVDRLWLGLLVLIVRYVQLGCDEVSVPHKLGGMLCDGHFEQIPHVASKQISR